MKNATFFGEIVEQYLPRNMTQSDALSTLTRLKNNQHEDLIPYELYIYRPLEVFPKLRSAQSNKCDCCTDRNGKPKKTYSTQNQAETFADSIYSEQRVNLKVYRCRNEVGWHLTKGD